MKTSSWLVIFCLLLDWASAQERVYTNNQGQKITAEVETVRSGKVFLKMNGKRFSVLHPLLPGTMRGVRTLGLKKQFPSSNQQK